MSVPTPMETSDMSTVTAQHEGPVFAIRLDGAAGNALTNADLACLGEQFRTAAAADCSIVTITGAGEDFCRGRDHADVAHSGPGVPTPEQLTLRVTRPVLNAFDELDRVRVPVVAAVQGRAWGLACALAGACDVTLVDRTVSFRLPEMQRDLPPTLAMSQLHRVVPRKALIDLVLRSPEFGAEAARDFGIATRIIDAGGLSDALAETVAELVARDREALVTVKAFLRAAPRLDGPATADLASALLSGVLASQAGRV
jgi:enoyl-CoA hydratase/carnithine racemase